MGDFLEVSYTGWLMQNHGMGQVAPPLLVPVATCEETFLLSPPNVQHHCRSLIPTRTKKSCCDLKLAQER